LKGSGGFDGCRRQLPRTAGLLGRTKPQTRAGRARPQAARRATSLYQPAM